MTGQESRRVILRKRTDGTPREWEATDDGAGYIQLQDVDGDAIDAGNPLPVTEAGAWEINSAMDVVANDSDKVFTVPANRRWQILNIYVEYTSTGDAGDRQLVIQVRNSLNNVFGEQRAGAVQAASLTCYYEFGVGVGDLTAFRDTDMLTTPIPPSWLLAPDWDIRVFDNNAVAAGDDMTVRILYAEQIV